MPRAQRVLVVDDEESFTEALAVGLRREGFEVFTAGDGVEAVHQFDIVRPDLVLLDINLPKTSGLDVCRDIRTKSRTPIIVVSARGSEIDAVVGLEVGADDYVTKPYRLRELIARMRAVIRRTPAQVAEPESQEFVVGDVSLDVIKHRVVIRGEVVALPLKEFELLHALLSEAGRVMTRDALLDRIWGPYYLGDAKTLDVHIKRLRLKVESDQSRATRIVTIRGVGYKYELPEVGA